MKTVLLPRHLSPHAYLHYIISYLQFELLNTVLFHLILPEITSTCTKNY